MLLLGYGGPLLLERLLSASLLVLGLRVQSGVFSLQRGTRLLNVAQLHKSVDRLQMAKVETSLANLRLELLLQHVNVSSLVFACQYFIA